MRFYDGYGQREHCDPQRTTLSKPSREKNMSADNTNPDISHVYLSGRVLLGLAFYV